MGADPPTATITSLDAQENNANRTSVFLDGDFAFGVHNDIVAKYGLHVGRTLSPDERKELEQEDEYVRSKQKALDYLAHKPRTEQEVRRKLQKNDVPPPVIDDVVARLYELDYLDDEAYARNYVHNRFASKKYGPMRIRRELEKRGIDRHVAERAVTNLFAEKDVQAIARQHAEKRWSRLDSDEDIRRRKQKLYRYLRRRGFTADTIYPIVDALERRSASV